eukprot:TRINITY_DN3383_c0_g1_i10.p1 TRINITY_DN3383_c0_g1~~TRINITY_DN3383_c0_g1_i10.p1  ORF type:complete len:189 (-),score=20.66 TRINITY_DN3383_c0_g1_i10:100-666(-)
MFRLISFMFASIFVWGQVASLLPEDFAILPKVIQQQYIDLQQTKTRLTAGWIRQQILWKNKGPRNYLFTVIGHQVPSPPVSASTILVCDNQSNDTDTVYSNVNTIPKLFSEVRAQIDSIQFLETSMNLQYDEVYNFPTESILRLQRIYYDFSADGEIIGMSMTGPMESGYKILEFIPLEDDASECVVS